MRGKELYEKLTDIDDNIILNARYLHKSKKAFNIKWLALASCFLILFAVSITFDSFDEKNKSNFEEDAFEPIEVVLELNGKLYSVVNTDKSIAYNNYNLEKEISSNLLGECLGEKDIAIADTGEKDTFEIYRYKNAPITKYNWFPRIILKSSDGKVYHALIGSTFDEDEQTPNEVLTVYGLLSSNDIVSIENEGGKIITDTTFIDKFYKGLFTKEYGGNNFLQENVYQNIGIDESEIDELYSKYADDNIRLKVKLKNGLVIGVQFTSHNYVEVDHGLYFKVNDDWLDLVSLFK